MALSSFRPKHPPREKRDRAGEFDSFAPRPRAAKKGRTELAAIGRTWVEVPLAGLPLLKTPARKSQDIRESARGEECLVRLPGICRGGTEHTIWSHAPLGAAGKGRGIKALDVCGCYACTACDAALDQAQRPAGMTREQVLLDWFMGHMRSLVILAQKGLL